MARADGHAAGRAPTSPAPTSSAAPTASCGCSRTTCGRPSGLAYALGGPRRDGAAGRGERAASRARSSPGLEALARDAAGGGARTASSDPRVVLLNDGPGAGALYEHRELGRRARPGDRDRRRSCAATAIALVLEASGAGRRDLPARRRRAADRRPTGRRPPLGELLIEPLRAGTLACVNSPGSGIADDKAVHTYVERMIGFYLGEPLLLRSVPGCDLGDPGELEPRARADRRAGDQAALGVRGRGRGDRPARSTRPSCEAAAAAVSARPAALVAQEPVALSLHPTVVDGVARRAAMSTCDLS